MRDLAPTIYRQRLVIEGLCPDPITADAVVAYLSGLSSKLGMKTLMEPITHRSESFGEAGWIHWETSGAHMYVWDEPVPFFSVDIYTCKHFDPDTAVEFTASRFLTTEIQSHEF